MDNHYYVERAARDIKEFYAIGERRRTEAQGEAGDRAAFEAALVDAGFSPTLFNTQLYGDYTVLSIQAAWLGWQGFVGEHLGIELGKPA